MSARRLLSHPSTPCQLVHSLHVDFQYKEEILCLRYELRGDVGRLRIPHARAPARADGLWRHTCFEAFVKPAGSDSYLELNFAPSGEWAAYRFDAYRDGMAHADIRRLPTVSCSTSPAQLGLVASIEIPAAAGARLAICAVIEDDSGQLSYWALAHPPGKPDFHHDDGFVLNC